MRRLNWFLGGLVILSLPSVVGCPQPPAAVDGGGDHDHDEESHASHACMHAEFGPDDGFSASSDASSAPTFEEGMRRYAVTLVDRGDGTFGGYAVLSPAAT